MLRKVLFWTHLNVGVVIGVIVFIMSITGVLLTYEKQILDWDEARFSHAHPVEGNKLTTDDVLQIMREKHSDEHHFYIRWLNDDARPVQTWAGRHYYLIDAYSGEILLDEHSAVAETLEWITDLHRWLAFTGENKEIGKNITAYSNLFFIFLIVSGAYLWFPRKFKWSLFKMNLLFKRSYKSRHVRDFNWHHVLGIWMLVPLFVIVSTATIFHFKWASSALYGIYGETLPERPKKPELTHLEDGRYSYHALFERAKQHANENNYQDWYSMWTEIGAEQGVIRFYIDKSLGNNPRVAYSLYLDMKTSEVLRTKYDYDWSRGGQAWDTARYLHTGEYYGVIGQTFAGIASLAACFLVYTGFTLSWRRLITPIIKRRKKRNIKHNSV